ncbi:MAG: hypothetical protein CO128_05820 [Ignavibacteriales bacterium CG_4_9_14_3_um_filter_30_11]|nr:MAG: hypothetical protein CO128_05820 [Ignavibacteriales bacterium CG_4_9_14_3_um_filter_30_11]
MAFLSALWLPILVSAAVVFLASSVIHMMFTYHKNDFQKLQDENEVMNTLRSLNISPGSYHFPFCGTSKEMKEPAQVEKMNNGPVGMLTVFENGMPKMGKYLFQWFLFCIVVSIFAAYIAFHALPVGGSYLEIFRFVGCTAFIGYSLAVWQGYIWLKKSFRYVFFSTFDGLIYGLLTAGVFGWLW